MSEIRHPYKVKLDEIHSEELKYECPPRNKVEFLGETIFDFTTYDSNASEYFAEKMIETLIALVNRTTFEYQKEQINYHWYLLMVNMPFLVGKLDWGTSIRGAWLDRHGHHQDTDHTYCIAPEFSIPKSEITIFIQQLIEWSKE